MSSADDTDSTESDGKYHSELDPDVDMRMEDDVEATNGVDLDGDVDMERDGDDEEEEDEEEDDEKKEEVVVDEDEKVDKDEKKDKEEEEDKDEDDGKEPRTIGQGEVVNTSADDVDTMVDDQPIVLPEQGKEMREHTSQPPPPPVPAPWPQTSEPCPLPRMPETHPLSGLEDSGLVTPQKPRLVVPSLRQPEELRNTLDLDVDQQLLGQSAGGDSLPDIPLPDVPLPDGPLPEALPDGSVGEE